MAMGFLQGNKQWVKRDCQKSKCRNHFKEMTLKWFVWQTPDLKILVYNFTDPAFPLSYFLFIFFLSFFKISEACEGCHYCSLSGFVCEVYFSVNLKCYCISPENPLEILGEWLIMWCVIKVKETPDFFFRIHEGVSFNLSQMLP